MTQLRMYRGDTTPFEITITTPDGARFDLTGCSIWFTAKRDKADADPGVFQLSTLGGQIVIQNQVDPATRGKATVTPLTTSTSSLTEDESLVYDVQIRTPGGLTYTPIVGTLFISRDVTHA